MLKFINKALFSSKMADDDPIAPSELEYVLLHFPDCLPSSASPLWVHEIDEGQEAEGDKLQGILSHAWEELLYTNPAKAFVVAARYGGPESNRYERAIEQLAPEDVSEIFGAQWRNIPGEHYQMIIIEMEQRGYYEEVLDFVIGHGRRERESFELTVDEFIQESPAEAFAYISQHREKIFAYIEKYQENLNKNMAICRVITRLKECLNGTEQEAAEILKAYERIDELHDDRGESDLKDILTEDALRAFPLRAELYQLCLERNDSFYWDIGRAMLCDDTMGEFPDEARVLAYEAGEEELLEQIEGGSLVPAYQSLVREAKEITRLVSRQYGIDLPKRVEVGGPTGSYASIKTRSAGSPNATEGKGNTPQEETANNGPGA